MNIKDKRDPKLYSDVELVAVTNKALHKVEMHGSKGNILAYEHWSNRYNELVAEMKRRNLL